MDWGDSSVECRVDPVPVPGSRCEVGRAAGCSGGVLGVLKDVSYYLGSQIGPHVAELGVRRAQ